MSLSILMMRRDTFLALGISMLTACHGQSMSALPDLPLSTTAPAFIAATPPASILAVGGTQQLSVTGVSLAGAGISTFDSVLYQYNALADSVRLRMTSGGLLTGLASTGATPVRINVIAFKEGTVRGDQVLAQVTPAAVTGLTLSIQPIAPDSAKLAAGVTKTITPVLRNPVTGIAVATPAVIYKIKGPDSARVDVYRGSVRYVISSANAMTVRPTTANSGLAPNQFIALSGEGTAWLYATVNAYGTVLQDSVRYAFSYPYTQTISTVKVNLAVQSMYGYTTLTLAPGAIVTFQNGVAATDPLTVAYAFDNPAAVTAPSPPSTAGAASGNVTTLTGGQTSRRQFLTSGTYHWTVIAAGGPAPWPGQTLAGTILVK